MTPGLSNRGLALSELSVRGTVFWRSWRALGSVIPNFCLTCKDRCWSHSNRELDALGTAAAPSHLIIGPPDASNLYSNANDSIAGNGPHNPFLDGTATFMLDIAGVTADTTLRTRSSTDGA